MSRFNQKKFLAVAIMTTLISGCDYGHSGVYRLSTLRALDTNPRTDSLSVSAYGCQTTIEQTVRQLGYKQGGVNGQWWFKAKAANIYIEPLGNDEWKLSIGKMGGDRQIREAKEAELELVRALLAQPTLRTVWTGK